MKDGLLSVTTISPNQDLLQQGLVGEETPETGNFNFNSYLLGLQESSLDLIQPEKGTEFSLIGLMQEEGENKDPLLKIFDKANKEMWNPMFPLQQIHTPAWMKAEGIDKESLTLSTEERTQENAFQANPLDVLVSRNEIKSTGKEDSLKGASKSVSEFLSIDKTQRPEKTERNEPELNQVDAFSEKFSEKLKLSEDKDMKGVQHTQQVQKKLQHLGENQFKADASDANVSQHSMETVKPQKEMIEGKLKSNHAVGDTSFLVMNSNTANVKGNESLKLEPQGNQGLDRSSLPEVFQKVESMIHQGGGKMTVLLSPPELGQVEIKVHARGKQVEIQVKSENDFAKQAIEAGVDNLRTSMHTNDLRLAKFEVQVGDMSNQGFDSHRWAQQMAQGEGSGQFSSHSQQSREENNNRSVRYPTASVMAETSRVNPSAVRTGGMGRGQIDIRI